MAATQIQAKDEMFAMFKAAWDTVATGGSAILSYVPPVYYHGVQKTTTPEADKYFAIMEMIVVDRSQATLAINVVNVGDRMYNNRGLLRLQVMCPLSDAENSDKGLRLGMVARDAFDGKRSPCGVLFRNAKVEPSLSTEVFSKHIMTVQYEYNEIT